MVVTQDLEKNGEVTCYVFFFMVLTPQISRPTLNTFGPIPVYDRAVSEGIDHGASAHVIGFAEVLELADVTGVAESSSSLASQAMRRTSPFSMKVASRSRVGSTGWRCFAGGP